MRGRRVALLLTGLWPLLAIDDVPATETNVTIENEQPSQDDTLSEQLPKLPLHAMMVTSNPSNIVMVDPVFEVGELQEEEYVVHEDVVHDSDDDSIIHHDQHVDQRTTSNEEAPHDAQEQQDEEEHATEQVSEGESISDDQDSTSQAADETKETASRDEPETTESSTEVSEHDAASSTTPSDSETSSDSSNVQTEETTSEEADSSNDTASETGEPKPTESPDGQTTEGSETEQPPQTDEEEEEEEIAADRVLVDYASKSAGALILEKSPAMKGTSNLLNDDNDKYAIAPCAEKKFVVVGLSEDILVKQVKLANFERYSSHLKSFQIMGSQTMGEWVDLGTYTAEPGNGEQAFDLKEPAWARYLKFRFLTHHGSEHYCTYSQIKVHGSTMLQGFHEQWDPQEDDENEDGSENGETEGESADNTESVKDNSDSNDEASEEGESASEKKQTETDDQGKEEETQDTVSKPVVDEPSASVDSQKESDAAAEDSSGDTHSIENGDEQGQTTTTTPDQESSSDNASPSSTDTNDETINEERITTDEIGVRGNDSQGPTGDEKPTLASASIPVSSHDASVSEHITSTEQLDTSAIKPVKKALKDVVATVVKEMATAEAIISVKEAENVLDEVKSIQESLKMTGTMPRAFKGEANVNEDESGSVNVEAEESDAGKETEASKASPEVLTKEESTLGNESDVVELQSESSGENVEKEQRKNEKPTEASPPPKEETRDSVSTESKGDKDDQTRQATRTEVAESTEKSNQEKLDPTVESIVARFPSAACMRNLDYQNFKAKISASRANSHGSQPSGHGGKMEPIFKLLTDEIRGLQTSQSVQDQYMKALISCYQQIMLEMANTLNYVETHQEKRISELEDAVNTARSGFFTNLLAVVAGVISAFVAGVQWLYKSMAASFEALVALSSVNDITVAILSFGFCSLCLLATIYVICAVRVKVSMKPSPRTEIVASDTATKEKKSETSEDLKKQPNCRKPTPSQSSDPLKIPEPPFGPDIVQSENESDGSDPATLPVIALAPRSEERRAEQPALVLMD